jgi:transposase
MQDLTMTQRDQARLQILNRVLAGRMTMVDAAALMGVSERHGWRLLARYRAEGAAALVHGNRGRAPVHRLAESVRQRVRELAATTYAGVNHSHLAELLAEREGIVLSRSSVRRILAVAGLRGPRRRRPPKHRRRRDRAPQEGTLLQVDGSRHAWLEERGPRLSLLAAIDDATGEVVGAIFREQEDAHGYFLVLQQVLRAKGMPLALYSDRHGIFQRPPTEKETLEEQLAGERQPTQVGRALRHLGIQQVFATSPQAKGRVERLWGTWQDRLVTELRLAGARTIDDANRVLAAFVPDFNARFCVPAAEDGSAYRPVAPGLCIEGVLCFTYHYTVARDNTVRFGGHTLQLLPNRPSRSFAHKRVEVQERLDGSIVIAFEGEVLATRPAPPDPVTLRARHAPRGMGADSIPQPPPLATHPWRRYPLTKSRNR